MLRLYKSANWYNPMCVNGYELDDIVFYDKNTHEEIHVGRGWFGNTNNYHNEIVFDIPDAKNYKKFRYEGNFLFKCKISNRKILYLDQDQFDIEIEKSVRSSNGDLITRHNYTINNEYTFSDYHVKTEPDITNRTIANNAIDNILEQIDILENCNYTIYGRTTIDDLKDLKTN